MLRQKLWSPAGRALYNAGRTMAVRGLAGVPTPATPMPEFPSGEPEGPSLVTEVPGPKSKALQAEMATTQDAGAVKYFVDFDKSKGNFVSDVDGNRLLDMYSHIASLPVGYNNPHMLEVFQNPANHSLLAHRPALGNAPPADWVDRLKSTLLSVAPKGLTHVQPMMCGSCANENAFKAIFIAFQERKRAGKPPSADELASCMVNESPGSPDLKFLSFHGAFHGRLLGCLSTTHSKAIHKLDVPAFDWPIAPFPKLKYPLEDNVAYNQEEEAKCLAAVDDILSKDSNVAGLIVEPIQAEGGDNHASPDFFRKLRGICKDRGVYFVCDEVQTGCGASGHFWAHEAWELETPPDAVTFSKKMQIAGYYCTKELIPASTYRVFNTWMGDPVRLLQLEAVIKCVKEYSLVENAKITGQYILDGVKALQAAYPGLLANARGAGTLVAFDAPTPSDRDAIINSLKAKGVDIPPCGEATIRCRPGLFFGPKHARIFLDTLEDAVVSHFKVAKK